jgi:hypothetical protein
MRGRSVSLILLLFGIVMGALAQPRRPDTLWTYTHLNPTGNDEAFAIAPAVGGGFVIGGETWVPDSGSRATLIRVDSNGQELWTRTYPWTSIRVRSIATLLDGGWVLACEGRVFCDMLVIRTDAEGFPVWMRCLTQGVLLQGGVSIAITPDSGFAVLSAGAWTNVPDIYLVRLSPDGDSLWTRTYGGTAEDHGGAVLATSDSGFFIAGSKNHQAWAIKTDSLGIVQWDTTFGDSTLTERLSAACITPDGDFIVSGWQLRGTSTYDPFLARVTAVGDTAWTRVLPSLGPRYSSCLALLPDGNIVLGGNAFWVVVLTPSGDTLWSAIYGDPNYTSQQALCVTTDHGLALAGYTCPAHEGSCEIVAVRTESLYPTFLREFVQPRRQDLLEANPNPFNSTTVISYSVPKTGDVKLALYDITGRLVRVLEYGRVEAGEHRVTLNAEGMSSGIYFVRMEAGGRAVTGKMVLLR